MELELGHWPSNMNSPFVHYFDIQTLKFTKITSSLILICASFQSYKRLILYLYIIIMSNLKFIIVISN